MNTNSRVLGFDFGMKRTGVATGNSLTKTSQPLTTITSLKSGADWNKIENLILEWKPGKLIVGLPLSMDGQETPISKQARRFGNQLSARAALEVIFVDERLSSTEADQIIKQTTPAGKKISKKHLSLRDNLAAQLIIQSYFEDN